MKGVHKSYRGSEIWLRDRASTNEGSDRWLIETYLRVHTRNASNRLGLLYESYRRTAGLHGSGSRTRKETIFKACHADAFLPRLNGQPRFAWVARPLSNRIKATPFPRIRRFDSMLASDTLPHSAFVRWHLQVPSHFPLTCSLALELR